ncbi:hypothetical protein [Acaryochloris marina]|uniref:Uncharacterized protein n=1 Tax=Acaryochloris marina (strain MBIC 11017) TaxID=329726 RepID=A8ZQ89_ACAM1|nr:hypothetical protein [Acaryochloris marina]ABW33076.1 hypothetical protein AM1_F0108 [Acaryochloris marina MBIC11017]
MTTDNNYSKVLLELKTKYEQTLAELEAQTNQLKTKLNSLSPLIENPALGADILSILQDASDSITPTATNSASTVIETVEPKTKSKSQKAAPKASTSTSKKSTSTSKKPPSQAKTKKTPQKKNTGRSSSTKLPMKKPYDQMTKMDAIEKFMQGNPGKVIHTDNLIKELFGELSQEQHKAERGRMKTAMYRGVRLKRWIKVPKKQMCFVYESHLAAESKKATTTKTQKSRKKTK